MIFYKAHAEVKPTQRELYFPSSPFQKVWNSFFPFKRAGILELLSAHFTQNDGAEQVGMCVLGRQGKVTFPCTKGLPPIPRQSNCEVELHVWV